VLFGREEVLCRMGTAGRGGADTCIQAEIARKAIVTVEARRMDTS
jgi:hypothetical protein